MTKKINKPKVTELAIDEHLHKLQHEREEIISDINKDILVLNMRIDLLTKAVKAILNTPHLQLDQVKNDSSIKDKI